MTESPIAVTCLPGTLPGVADRVGTAAAAGPVPTVPGLAVPGLAALGLAALLPLALVPAGRAAADACAWVAALTCSPSWICLSIPAGAAA
jgi:Zn-dependent alcohol dehydrogenase